MGRGPWGSATRLVDGWVYAVEGNDGKRALVLAPETDVSISTRARRSAPSMQDLHEFANTAEGFIVREPDVVSMTKGSRLWGPNTIVNLVFNHNDASANVWLTRWAIQTEPGLVPRMTIVVAAPKGRIKAIVESLGKRL